MDQLGERRHKPGIVRRLLSSRPRLIKGCSAAGGGGHW
jgi:hypothetical protein